MANTTNNLPAGNTQKKAPVQNTNPASVINNPDGSTSTMGGTILKSNVQNTIESTVPTTIEGLKALKGQGNGQHNGQGNPNKKMDGTGQGQGNGQFNSNNVLLDANKNALQNNNDLGKQLTDITTNSLKGNEKGLQAELGLINDTAKANEKILTDTQNQSNALIQGTANRINNETAQKIDLLNAQRDNTLTVQQAETKRLQALQEQQRIQNENAIIQAQTQTELEKQKSAWAFQKLHLGFSSGIILQSQEIATQGIAKIAEIKAKMNYQEAVVGVQIAQVQADIQNVQLKYTGMINDTISVASDKLDGLDNKTLENISKYQNNLLLNNTEKRDKINKELEDHAKEKRDIQRQHIDDMQKIQDKGLQYTKEIQTQIDKQRQLGLENATNLILNGTVANMSDIELMQLEKSLNLPTGTIKQKTTTQIQQGIRGLVDNAIGKDYTISNIDGLTNSVNELMKQGRTLSEAVNSVTNNYLKNNPDYIKARNNKDALDKAKINQLNAQSSYYYNRSTSSSSNSSSVAGGYAEYKNASPDLKNIVSAKDFSKMSASERLQLIEGAKTNNRIRLRNNKDLQAVVDTKVKQLEDGLGALPWNDTSTAKIMFNDAVTALEGGGYTKNEIIDKLNSLSDMKVVTLKPDKNNPGKFIDATNDYTKVEFYNNSDSRDNFLGSINIK